jgi:DNA-binding transcriptional ArsR family regulator
MDLVFGALADPTRRDIVRRVLGQPASVSELARRYPMSFAAVQKHVALLEQADLVRKERHGREQLVQGNLDGLRRATRLLDELEDHWRDRLNRFGDMLEEVPAAPVKSLQRRIRRQPTHK